MAAVSCSEPLYQTNHVEPYCNQKNGVCFNHMIKGFMVQEQLRPHIPPQYSYPDR